MAEPFVPVPHGTALSDCARRNPSEIPSWPALFMSASTTIANPLLRRAFGQRARPSDPHRTTRVRIGSSRLRAPVSAPLPPPPPYLWGGEGWGTTNRHEQCGLDSVSFPADSNRGDSEEARRTLRYVEPLNEARTLLADFFRILLNGYITSPSQFRSFTPIMVSGHCCPRQDLTRAFLPVTN